MEKDIMKYNPLDVAGTAAANVAIRDLMDLFYLMNGKFALIMSGDPLLQRELADYLSETYKDFSKAYSSFLSLNGKYGNKNKEIARRISIDVRHEKEEENEKV